MANMRYLELQAFFNDILHTAKDPRFWSAAKPHSDTLARLYGLVRGYPEVIGSQLPVIRAQ